MIEFLKIVLLVVGASIAYGILHDQVTARICVEYFTIFHARIVDSESPTVLALVWGVVATWWAGLGMGIPIAVFARVGNPPKLSARDLLKPIAFLMLGMGIAALVAGSVAYQLAVSGEIALRGRWASRIPPEKQFAFLADLWAHRTAYGAGVVGSIFLCGWNVYKRNLLMLSCRNSC